MRYLSVCSGIEAATVAWHPLGWELAAFSEIEPFPRSVLAHHYPHVPLHGDFTTIKGDEYGATDLLVGGTPCQSFSVAGLRKGLDDPRGNLMLEYGALAKRLRANWLVWENVPGVLSSNGGRDFAAFLGMLAELGYGFAYRVLDAQYFGVPQRRRRVFVVGCLGDWRSAAAVLFERHSLQGHPAPSREASQGFAPCASGSADGGGWPHDVAGTPDAHYGDKLGLENQHVFNQRGSRFVPHPARTIGSSYSTIGCFKGGQGSKAGGIGWSEYVAPTLSACPSGTQLSPTLMQGTSVRRLTPRECERLQGFPDDYTLVPHRGKPAADGPRYKALGNSMAVPVMAWIGQRINQVEAIRANEPVAA